MPYTLFGVVADDVSLPSAARPVFTDAQRQEQRLTHDAAGVSVIERNPAHVTGSDLQIAVPNAAFLFSALEFNLPLPGQTVLVPIAAMRARISARARCLSGDAYLAGRGQDLFRLCSVSEAAGATHLAVTGPRRLA